MFKELLQEPAEDEQWDVYYPVDNNWPLAGSLEDYDVSILTPNIHMVTAMGVYPKQSHDFRWGEKG